MAMSETGFTLSVRKRLIFWPAFYAFGLIAWAGLITSKTAAACVTAIGIKISVDGRA